MQFEVTKHPADHHNQSFKQMEFYRPSHARRFKCSNGIMHVESSVCEQFCVEAIHLFPSGLWEFSVVWNAYYRNSSFEVLLFFCQFFSRHKLSLSKASHVLSISIPFQCVGALNCFGTGILPKTFVRWCLVFNEHVSPVKVVCPIQARFLIPAINHFQKCHFLRFDRS